MRFLNLTIILLYILITGACSKSSSSTAYHITCKIDGVPTSFNVNIKGGRQIWSYPVYQTIISGWQTADSSSGNFGIAIATQDTINNVGNYIDTTVGYNIGSSFLSDGRYSQQDYSAGSYLYVLAHGAGIDLQNHLVIKVTLSTAHEIKGTFNGDFYYGANPTLAKKTITDGDFYVKIE